MQNLNQRGLHIDYTTAVSIRDPANRGEMLPIQQKLPWGSRCWNAPRMLQEIQSAEIRSQYANELREELGELFYGHPSNWYLWHLQILPQQLKLLYRRRVQTQTNAAEVAMAEQSARTVPVATAVLTLTAPVGIVCDFVVPALPGVPERRVHYRAFRYQKSDLDPFETCAVKVVEKTQGAVSFRFELETPYFGAVAGNGTPSETHEAAR